MKGWKKWIAGIILSSAIAGGAFAVMCEFADFYHDQYVYHRDVTHNDDLMAAYFTAWQYAQAECNGEYDPIL